jgi:UDP-N-acetylglucosamine transferase subunit ALG13
VLQTGEVDRPLPPVEGIEMHRTLPFDEVRALLRRANIVVCHGGTGSIITALREGCRVIVVPRRFERGEHYDDHQAEISDTFAQRGLTLSADTDAEFADALAMARQRVPVRATTDPGALIAHLRELVARWTAGRRQ